MKIKSSEIGKLKNKPIFEGLPDELKTKEAYKEIESRVKLIMVSDHKHRKIERFMDCPKCKDKMQKRHDYLIGKGFKDYTQYLEWRRVMDIIIKGVDFKVS